LPSWVEKLARRIMGLRPGTYLLLLTIGREHDLTVLPLGSRERLG